MTNIECQTRIYDAVNGNRKAMNQLLESVRNKIFNISVHYSGDFHLAEDYTQEILIKISNNLHQLQNHTKFYNWAFTIAANYLKSQLKRNEKYNGISFDRMAMESSAHLNPTKIYDEDFSEHKDFVYELKISCTTAMLMCLKDEDRMLFLLSSVAGFKSNDISEIFDLKPDNVRKRVSRAYGKLKNFIDNNCGLINKSNPCQCKARINYAIDKGRIQKDGLYFQNPVYIHNDDVMKKMALMEELEDVSEIFRNNPNYRIESSLMEKVEEIAKI